MWEPVQTSTASSASLLTHMLAKQKLHIYIQALCVVTGALIIIVIGSKHGKCCINAQY